MIVESKNWEDVDEKTKNLMKALEGYFLSFSPGSEGQFIQFQMSSGVDVRVEIISNKKE